MKIKFVFFNLHLFFIQSLTIFKILVDLQQRSKKLFSKANGCAKIQEFGGFMTDIEIARSAKLKKITEIAKKIDINEDELELYGPYKAKVNEFNFNPKAKLVLVTAINPTMAGEGKTTVSIGLGDAFSSLHRKVCLALREPSLGPVFGLKGGATGGGKSQIAPMEDINLHFTGDFHALTSANNLLCAYIDNHIFHGNELNIDENNIVFNRCLDLNDRALRNVLVGGGKNGVQRKDRFNITASSELMAILCLASDIEDLKKRIGNILVAYTKDGKPIYAKDLHAEESMTILLKDAIKPNLVQTLSNTPAIVHGGPFANIAHGCNSIIATKLAMTHSNIVVTEAGFGADLGAEKFLDTKCRIANIKPNAVVVVATIRALKMHGGASLDSLSEPNLQTLKLGMENLIKHVKNMTEVYHLPTVVAINKFTTDTQDEIELIKQEMGKINIVAVPCDVWAKGGEGAIDLAKEVEKLFKKDNSQFTFAYDIDDSITTKIEKISTKIYGAKGVKYTEKAQKDIEELTKLGFDKLPVVIAKTQMSLSDNKNLLGAPKDFEVTIREVQSRGGAGFVVAIAGSILLMPGLPTMPAGMNMKIEDGTIFGLF
jgi:formate--tetrahydrofolate ligase